MEISKSQPEKGEKKKIPHDRASRIVMSKYTFKTLRDTEELLWYDKLSGLYRKRGEVRVKESLQAWLVVNNYANQATAGLMEAVIKYIKRETYVDRDQFNSLDNLLVVKNGILDMDTLILYKHSPNYLFTTGIPVDYHPNIPCPCIDEFIKKIAQPEDVAVLYEVFGWCLDLNSGIQAWILLWGDGSNGKSTYINLIGKFIGEENCSHASLQSLMNDRFAIANLYGKRANIFADLTATSLAQAGLIKALTGGDHIQANEKYMPFFDFQNKAKLIFSANQTPSTKDDSQAFWRRIILIDCKHKFEGKDDIKNYIDIMATPGELIGLLNKALQARKQLRASGYFSYVRNLEQVRERYLARADSVSMYIDEKCRVERGVWLSIGKEELYQGFVQFCGEKGIPVLTKKKFGHLLKEKLKNVISEGQDSEHHSIWHGIGLSVDE